MLSHRCLIDSSTEERGGQRFSGVLSERGLTDRSTRVGGRLWMNGILSDRGLTDRQETEVVEIEGGVCVYPGKDKRSWSASTQNKIYHCAVLNSTVVLLSSSSALQSLEVVSHVRTEHQRV